MLVQLPVAIISLVSNILLKVSDQDDVYETPIGISSDATFLLA